MHPSAPHNLITTSSAKSTRRLALVASWIGLSVGLAACAEAPDPIPGTGGTASGGAATGGGASGGASSGGAGTGGGASGGAVSGGAGTGGGASGGAASGGAGTGGGASGGAASGGAGTGGDSATGGAGTGGAASTVSFEDVTDILTARCATNNMCHGTGAQRIIFTNDEGLYGRITTMSATHCADSKFVTPSNSATSAIVMAITGQGCTDDGQPLTMPPRNGPLPAEDIATIEAWIDAGAPE